MTLEFNIIYTPGTVKYLSFFVWSLLKWSDCAFRLVSNGCLLPEQRLLQRMCRQDPRLEFWTIPTRRNIPHGQALNYLQAMNISDYFCFMDSDIFATGNFMRGLRAHLESHSGVFSGAPLWVKRTDEVMPATFRHLAGVFNRNERGDCLGSTYVALYDNQLLTTIMQSTGIGFEEYRWQELPQVVQASLAALGLDKASYDTGKVLNLLVLAQKSALIYVDSPDLCHIGGASFQIGFDHQPPTRKGQVLDLLMNSLVAAPLRQLRQWRVRSTYRHHYQSASEAEFQFNVRQRSQQRNPVRQYLLQLLNSAFQNAVPPEPPVTGDDEIDIRLRNAKILVLHVFEEYRDKLALTI